MSTFTARQHVLKINLNAVLSAEEGGHGGNLSGCKIIATIGPACQSAGALGELLEAGAVGARLDLTWGPLEFHRASVRNLQVAMQQARKLCCTLVDTIGREVMVRRQIQLDESGWPVQEESFTIKAGQEVILTTRLDAVASSHVMPLTYDRFHEMAQVGDTVYVGRYLVSGADSASLYLEVTAVNGPDVTCVAQNEAVLQGLLTVFHTERSTNTLSNVQNALPLLSDYDKEAIQSLSDEFEIDFLSLSYTRCEEDVHEARAWLSSIGCRNTRVLAKIETRQSLLNFEGILSAADGIIMSRGNLGLDCVPEKMAVIQKTLVQACNLAGKPVIITRVVDTMVDAPRPTRAEATDVANAALDGVDGILLGAETLRGKYPANCVRTISSICRSAEKVFDYQSHYDFLMEHALEDEEERAMVATGDGPVELDAWGAVRGSTQAPTTVSHLTNATSLSEAGLTCSLVNLSPGSSPGSSAGDVAEVGQKPVKVKPQANKKMTAPVTMAKVATFDTALHSQAAVNSRTSSATQLNLQLPVRKSHGPWRSPYLSKLESIASSAVRVADKVAASLMLVYTHSGATAALVAKYKPPMPILCLVVPSLTSNGLSWQLQGRVYARQSLLVRGLLPVLANPSTTGEEGLNEAIEYAASLGLVKPNDHIVCIERTHNDSHIKVVTVDEFGMGVKRLARISETRATPSAVRLLEEARKEAAAARRGPLLHSPSENLPDTP